MFSTNRRSVSVCCMYFSCTFSAVLSTGFNAKCSQPIGLASGWRDQIVLRGYYADDFRLNSVRKSRTENMSRGLVGCHEILIQPTVLVFETYGRLVRGCTLRTLPAGRHRDARIAISAPRTRVADIARRERTGHGRDIAREPLACAQGPGNVKIEKLERET